MYFEKHINFDIINLIIIDLLHLNNNESKIEEVEFEALYTIVKLLKEQKSGKLQEFKIIFDEFSNIIKKIIENENNKISKRSIFFLNDVIDMLHILYNGNSIKNNEVIKKNNNDELNIFSENLKKNNINELISIYKNKKNDNNNKKIMINKFINYFIDHKNNNLEMINFLLNIETNDSLLIYEILDIFVYNIKDIILDVIDANNKIIYIIENLKVNNIKKNEYLEILKNINNEESDIEEGSDLEKGSEIDEENDNEKECILKIN
jgi:hypothetical protein